MLAWQYPTPLWCCNTNRTEPLRVLMKTEMGSLSMARMVRPRGRQRAP